MNLKNVKPIAMRRKREITNIQELNKKQKKSRRKRHVGPHDDDGIQRLISTASLMPSLLPKDHPKYNNSIDVVFATFWFFPAKTQAILPEDQKCIEKKLSDEAIRFNPDSKLILSL